MAKSVSHPRKWCRVVHVVTTIVLIMVFAVEKGGNVAAAQAPSQGAGASEGALGYDLRYDLQRSYRLYNYKGAGASGPQRGEQIYFFKCWVCHNQYTQKQKRAGPPLKDLYKGSVNDQEVAEKIKQGGLLMPAFRYSLTEVDLADLLSYLRSRKCCYEGEDPLPNPWYRNP